MIAIVPGVAKEIGRLIDLYEDRRVAWERSPKPSAVRWDEEPVYDWEGDIIAWESGDPIIESDRLFARMIQVRDRLESLMRRNGVRSAMSRYWTVYFDADGRIRLAKSPYYRTVITRMA